MSAGGCLMWLKYYDDSQSSIHTEKGVWCLENRQIGNVVFIIQIIIKTVDDVKEDVSPTRLHC